MNSDRPMTKQDLLSTVTFLKAYIGECDIHPRPDASPVIHPHRRMPLAMRDKLKTELDSMEHFNVICKVTYPTEWVNTLVTVEKSMGHSGCAYAQKTYVTQ